MKVKIAVSGLHERNKNEDKMDINFLTKDWIMLVTTIVMTLGWPIILFRLKPNLDIESVDKNVDTLKIKVKNIGCFDALNLRIEACYIPTGTDFTCHFETDKVDFLILPKKNKNTQICSRDFKINSVSESTKNFEICRKYDELLKKLVNKQGIIRVRVHAYHSFSGFGKAFEQIFEWKDGKFIKFEENPSKICKIIRYILNFFRCK